jgi:hypothetical protein
VEGGREGERSSTLPDFLKDRKRLTSEFWRGAVEQGIINPPTTHTQPTPPEKKIPPPPPVREAEGKGGEKRVRKVPDRLTYVVRIPEPDTLIPKTLREAKNSPYWEGFEEAIGVEISGLEKNQTWEYIDIKTLPRGTNILRSKFVFDIKRGSGGEFLKYKARMVAMGFTQVEGVDYDETFASVMTTKTFRILLAIWNLDPKLNFEHWDVKTAFINAPLKEVVYCRQVPGFERPGCEGKILRLKRALYGTKQAANAWQNFLSSILKSCGGKRHLKDECVYIFRGERGGFVLLSTHVDDLFPLYNKEGEKIRDKILQRLKEKMEIDNKGTLSFALDTKIERDPEMGVLKISQAPYILSLLKEFGMENSKGRETPAVSKDISEEDLPTTEEGKKSAEKLPVRNVIGRLWWLALISRPDRDCALHKCAIWQNKPSDTLWSHLMDILKYLNNTRSMGLVFKRPENCFPTSRSFHGGRTKFV